MSPEYSAHELSELRQKQMVEAEVERKSYDLDNHRPPSELKAEIQKIHASLKANHYRHTTRIQSHLP